MSLKCDIVAHHIVFGNCRVLFSVEGLHDWKHSLTSSGPKAINCCLCCLVVVCCYQNTIKVQFSGPFGWSVVFSTSDHRKVKKGGVLFFEFSLPCCVGISAVSEAFPPRREVSSDWARRHRISTVLWHWKDRGLGISALYLKRFISLLSFLKA